MKTIDVVKLALAGKSADEIRELAAVEAELAEKELNTPAPASDPVQVKDDQKEPEPAKNENQDKDEKKEDPETSKKDEDLKKEVEDLKNKLAAAQKANMNKDISGRKDDEPTDLERFNDFVASCM